MNWFTTTSTRRVHDGHLGVRVDGVATPDGGTVMREVVETPDAVVVVPLTRDGDVVLVRQYRHPTGRAVLELPAGLRDVEGETPERTAARELAEECGLAAASLEVMLTAWVSPGWATERSTLVLASDVVPVPAPEGFVPEAEEAALEVVRLPLEAAVAAVHDGTIDVLPTALGILLAAERCSRAAS